MLPYFWSGNLNQQPNQSFLLFQLMPRLLCSVPTFKWQQTTKLWVIIQNASQTLSAMHSILMATSDMVICIGYGVWGNPGSKLVSGVKLVLRTFPELVWRSVQNLAKIGLAVRAWKRVHRYIVCFIYIDLCFSYRSLKSARQMAAEASLEDEAAVAASSRKTKKIIMESSRKISA